MSAFILAEGALRFSILREWLVRRVPVGALRQFVLLARRIPSKERGVAEATRITLAVL
jgi:hypothetical protein